MNNNEPSEICLSNDFIVSAIYFIRGEKVMLDTDLAMLYGVETRVLKQAVRRNVDRFPADFMFRVTKEEYDALRSQSVILKRGQHSKYLPFAFTEHGISMLSSVLNSRRAILVNIAIIRTFVQIRKLSLRHESLEEKINTLEKKFDERFKIVFQALRLLIKPMQKSGKKIGFKDYDSA